MTRPSSPVRESIADAVLARPDPYAAERAAQGRLRAYARTTQGLAAIVLGSRRSAAGPSAAAVMAALALHAGLSLAAARTRRPPQPRPAAAARPMLVLEHEVTLAPKPSAPEPQAKTPPPEPAPAAKTVPAPDPRPASRPATPPPEPTRPPPSSAPETPPPPAEAGRVVAAEADAMLDFTGFEMTSGNAPRYAGGVTAASGSGRNAVHTRHVDPNASPDSAHGTDQASLARPVGVAQTDWSDCDWPPQADALSIDEQAVLLQIDVRADGTVASVRALSNPGHGFAEHAVRCARKKRYPPARDARGRAIQAKSPPIRVRFTR